VLLGALTALLQPLSDWLGSVYGAANWAVLRLTIWFTRWVATPSWASLSTHWFTPLHGAVAWSLLWTVLSIRSSGIRLALPVTLLLLSIAVWLPPDHRFSPAEGSMRVTVLDVGQGDALFIQGPTGRRILIDAGPASPYSDAARRVILPFLDRTGSRRVDALLLTHGHRDHTGGVPTLLREAEIRSIFAPPDLARRITLETGRAVTPLASGERIDIGRGARCYGLAPGGEREAEGNASSVVVKLLTPHGSWLLAGDASLDVEERLIRRYGRFLSASVLKVGHHGSGGSTGDGFIDAVSPSIAIISVGKNNPFAHPSPQVLRRLRSRRIAVLRTDCEGAAVTEDRSLASPDGSGYVLSWR
jgi:DNA internalization-related competence protein ComEC/Rec2